MLKEIICFGLVYAALVVAGILFDDPNATGDDPGMDFGN